MEIITEKIYRNEITPEIDVIDLIKERTKHHKECVLSNINSIADETGEYYLLTFRKKNKYNL